VLQQPKLLLLRLLLESTLSCCWHQHCHQLLRLLLLLTWPWLLSTRGFCAAG
jgi:hypothetical protein